MSVVVVAVIEPKPGRTQDVLDAFAEVSPLVHEEPGCELYAAHTDGSSVVMVERWASPEDLQAHATGAALATLSTLFGDALTKPATVYALQTVPIGDPAKGTIA